MTQRENMASVFAHKMPDAIMHLGADAYGIRDYNEACHGQDLVAQILGFYLLCHLVFIHYIIERLVNF